MAFESLLAYSRLLGEPSLNKRSERANESQGVAALEGCLGNVYTEQAFRHFLDVERVRASHSGRTFLLLLVRLHRPPVRNARFEVGVATSLLEGLGACVRDVDFTGWYREGRIAGAVLAQGLDEPDQEASRRIIERVTRVLGARMPKSAADRLRVRVVRFNPRAK
jgi:hypothetical protein